MGLVMTGMTAGIISGPVIAGWLTVRCGWYAPFLLTAAGSLVMWIACCFVFRGVSRVPLNHQSGPVNTIHRHYRG